MRPTFNERFSAGKTAERKVAEWLRWELGRPLIQLHGDPDSLCGPKFLVKSEEYLSPDILLLDPISLCEAKWKGHASYYGKGGKFQVSIDKKYFDDYYSIWFALGLRVNVLFWLENPTPDPAELKFDPPPEAPTGLYGESIHRLKELIDHEGPGGVDGQGMYYWNVGDLKFVAPIMEGDVLGISESLFF